MIKQTGFKIVAALLAWQFVSIARTKITFNITATINTHTPTHAGSKPAATAASTPMTSRNPSDEFWKGYQENRTISFIHVGKAGGMTLRTNTALVCIDEEAIDIPACVRNRFPSNATLALQMHSSFHMSYSKGRQRELEKATSYVVALRNPVDRIISSFRYSHPANCIGDNCWGCRVINQTKVPGTPPHSWYNACYPDPGMEDWAQNSLSPYPPFNTHGRNMTAEDIRTCRDIAARGTSGRWDDIPYKDNPNIHARFNYRWYFDHVKKHLPGKEVFGIRTEHELEDLRDLDVSLGGVGNIGSKKVSHGSEGYAKLTLSQEGYEKLCCLMEEEIQIYNTFLELSLNLNESKVRESMENVRKKCNITVSWEVWRADCRARKAASETTSTSTTSTSTLKKEHGDVQVPPQSEIGSPGYFQWLCGREIEFPPPCPNITINANRLTTSNRTSYNATQDIAARLDCYQQEQRAQEQPQVNFFSFAHGKNYLSMLILSSFFALQTLPRDSVVEMVVDDPNGMIQQHAAELMWLLDQYGDDSICLRRMDPRSPKRTKVSNSWRFLEVPVRQAKYTYIGDIDLFLTESVLHPMRLQQMRHFNISYSNIIRKDTTRLTGLVLVETENFYTPRLRAIQQEFDVHRLSKPHERRAENDEVYLYNLCNMSGLGLPDPFNESDPFTYFRPEHGLHLSLNRGPGKRLCLSNFDEKPAAWCSVLGADHLTEFMCVAAKDKQDSADLLLPKFVKDVTIQMKGNMAVRQGRGKYPMCQ